MSHLAVETEEAFTSLLELAANNDVEGFKRSIERDPSCIDEIGLWYFRQNGSKQMGNVHRTPLMVAASYGCIDVMRLILSLSNADVNYTCGIDKSTALHCAASGGAVNAIDVVKLLLAAGADPSLVDANANRPVDIIVVPPKLQGVKCSLEELLRTDANSNSSSLLSSPENDSPSSSASNFTSSAMKLKLEKKEYPIDPSLPDIKNGIYSTDEFRMYSFKVWPCSRAYSHDWTECPFVHPGENARRRDPRKYLYSCVPCPDFRKGDCRHGDMCEYAHGVFESWLHPAQYRTRLCKDGTSCDRRVCFFAHTAEELRPLYASTGSAVPSPCSPSLASMVSPPFTPPMSPSGNGHHSSVPWSQPNVPTLHLPGSNFQSSRLRSSLITNSLNHSGRLKTLTSSNLDHLFSAEGSSSSPRYADQTLASFFSPKHKPAKLSPFQQPQGMLSPINTNFSPKNAENPFMQSPQNSEPISPMRSHMSMLAQYEKQQHFRSLSSQELGSNSSSVVGSPVNSWSKCGYSDGKPDWAISTDGLGNLYRTSSFDLRNVGEEPDLYWVQSLVKESSTEIKENTGTPVTLTASNGLNVNPQIESADMLRTLLEQMQLDQLVTQKN